MLLIPFINQFIRQWLPQSVNQVSKCQNLPWNVRSLWLTQSVNIARLFFVKKKCNSNLCKILCHNFFVKHKSRWCTFFIYHCFTDEHILLHKRFNILQPNVPIFTMSFMGPKIDIFPAFTSCQSCGGASRHGRDSSPRTSRRRKKWIY